MQRSIMALVNPENPTQYEIPKLLALLQQHSGKAILERGVAYDITYRDVGSEVDRACSLMLTNDVVQYQRKKNPAEKRHAILGDILGSGGQGSVYEINYTLKMNGATLESKCKGISDKTGECNQRVGKIMKDVSLKLSGDRTVNAADHEHDMQGLMSDYFHHKALIRDDLKKENILIMRLFEGQTLSQIFHNRKIANLSVEQKFDLCKKLLMRLQKVHEAGVVHRDIKPDNIQLQLDKKGNVVSVNLFDLGYAKRSGLSTSGGHSPGTVPYASPEAHEGLEIDEPADVYAMGRIFWQIWGNSVAIDCDMKAKLGAADGLKIAEYMPEKGVLFKHIPPQDFHDELYQLLCKINLLNPQQRIKIDECINLIDSFTHGACANRLIK